MGSGINAAKFKTQNQITIGCFGWMLPNVQIAKKVLKFIFVLQSIIMVQRANEQAFAKAAGAQKNGIIGIPFFELFDEMSTILIEIIFKHQLFKITFTVWNLDHR